MNEDERVEKQRDEKQYKAMRVMFVIVVCCMIAALACVLAIALAGAIREEIAERNQAKVESTIIAAACNEMEITPETAELHLLRAEWVPWLGCNTYLYALVADGDVYLVGVNGTETDVRYVDVIEKVGDYD